MPPVCYVCKGAGPQHTCSLCRKPVHNAILKAPPCCVVTEEEGAAPQHTCSVCVAERLALATTATAASMSTAASSEQMPSAPVKAKANKADAKVLTIPAASVAAIDVVRSTAESRSAVANLYHNVSKQDEANRARLRGAWTYYRQKDHNVLNAIDQAKAAIAATMPLPAPPKASKHDFKFALCESIWREVHGGMHAFKLDEVSAVEPVQAKKTTAKARKKTAKKPEAEDDDDDDLGVVDDVGAAGPSDDDCASKSDDDGQFPHDQLDDIVEHDTSNTTIESAMELLKGLKASASTQETVFLYDTFTSATLRSTRARRVQQSGGYVSRGCPHCDKDIVNRPDSERMGHIGRCEQRIELEK